MKELNVMLVDDDRIILDDIRSMIDWEANGLRIVATAPNGKKAFELYRHYMPDIVITDIKMPIMDGMELVEKIREISADTKILLLTSYKEFEYAKKAIEQGISDYYLKNDISAESFLKKLLSIREDIEKQLKTYSQSLHHVMEDLIEDGPDIALESVGPQIRAELEKQYYFLLVDVCMPLRIAASPADENHAALVALSKKLERLRPFEGRCLFHAIGNFHILLALTPQDAVAKPMDMFRDAALQISHFLEEESGIQCCFGYSLSCMDILGYLTEFYPELSHRHDAAFLAPGTLFDLADTGGQAVQSIAKKIMWELRKNFDTLEEAGLHRIADDFFRHAGQTLDFSSVRDLCAQAFVLLEEYCQQQDSDPLWAEHTFLQAILSTAKDMEQWFFQSFESIFRDRRQRAERGYSQSTQNAVAYIDRNFNRLELSVAEIARAVCLSSGRISVLFKRETGETLNEYITKVRIRHAKKLLATTPLKVYEIAERVGYGSGQYFSQIFQQYTGLKPKDYRQGKKA